MSDRVETSVWAGLRPWAPDAVLGALVLVVGILEQVNLSYLSTSTRWNLAALAAVIALAVGLARRAPGLALVLVWFACGLQLVYSVPILLAQAAVVVVGFGAARWGSALTVVLSGLSIPAAGVIAVLFLRARGFASVFDVERYRTFYETAQRLSDTWQVGAGILATAFLAVPWMAGLVLRFSTRATESRESQVAAEEQAARARAESEQAREVARLREEQAQMARDVHDVVGHSLAVILAQAESAQFLDKADTGALRLSMANIASSARASLQDVRHVLTSATEPTGTSPGELHDLVENVRASGHGVRLAEVGATRSLAPELATVAYRVLQEMLTNAIRHGRRDTPIEVELHWGGELRIETVNAVAVRDEADPVTAPGHGLDGMRRRLESVGGRLDVRRRGTDETTFTATAWVPVRTVYT